MDFFFLKNSLVDLFMRCLSYRLIKIHRKFTSAYLLCDKAALTSQVFVCSILHIFSLRLYYPNLSWAVRISIIYQTLDSYLSFSSLLEDRLWLD